MTAAILAIAWVGAVAWPVVVGLAAAVPRLRRSARARAFAALVTAAWAVGACAFLVEPAGLVVREVSVESELWDGPPLRIGLISDVHVGAHMSPERVGRIAERMNALEPHIVLLAGDYVSGHVSPDRRSDRENAAIAEGLAALGGLDAPLGVLAVLGNHDWWYDGGDVETALENAGIDVLENESRAVDRGGGELFWVAGLADYDSERTSPNWRTALAAVPDDADVVGLAHWPDVFWETPDGVALTAVGHTHCGQVNLPLLGRPAVSSGAAEWPCGLYTEQKRALYVTGGVGVSVLPVRFRVPPEIVVLTLTAAAET